MLDGQYITVEEASRQLGITEQGVRARIRRGQLTATKQRRAWFVLVGTGSWNSLTLPNITDYLTEWRV